MTLTEKKSTAEAWFRQLRDSICAEFEAVEAEHAERSGEPRVASHGEPERSERGGAVAGASSPPAPKAQFTKTAWQRQAGGGGEIGLMKGRVFEKVGVNISTVHGEFSEQFRKEIPGAAENPTFWAAGISLVAHPTNPLVPAAHMNTRMIVVGDGLRLWFGGGGDLTPTFAVEQDTAEFHAAFRKACDGADARRASTAMSPHGGAEQSEACDLAEQNNITTKGFYPAFTSWCREYFWLPHRGEERGVGGIFYDYLGLNGLGADTTPLAAGKFGGGGLGKEATVAGVTLAANAGLDWSQSFAFTQSVGTAFRDVYSTLVRRHMHDTFTPEQKHAQLMKRGRYAEYNLLYDRGTRFGLMTGGNPEAILMSLPPVAVWE